jgi:hypothetical protein
MKLKELKILVNIAVVLLLVSIFVFLNSQSGFKQTKEEILVQDFDKLLADLHTIKLSSQEHETVIQKDGVSWILISHDNFPANAETLRKFFYNLREAKIIGLKTSKEELLYKLGLSEESKIRIDLDNQDGQSIENFELGVFNYLVGGTYVKNIDDSQAYLVSSNISTDAEGFNWMSPYLINIGPNQVKKVTIMKPFKKKIILKKENEDFLELQTSLPKTIDEYILKDVQGNLQSIESEGYILRKDLENKSPILKAEYEFLNNSFLLLNFFEIDKAIFMTLDFTNLPSNLPLEKRITDSFTGDQYEISSNALMQFGFQVNKMNYDNLNIEPENNN